MADSAFDPGGFFQFDLAHGAIRAKDGSRVLALSESVLAPLIATAVGNGDLTAVRSLGSQLGHFVASSLGQDPASAPTSQVIGHAASVMSLYGWGRLRLERWGDALVLEVDGLPPLDDDHLAVAALLGGLFSTLCQSEIACVPISDSAKYLMCDPRIAENVWAATKGGDDLATIVQRLAVQEGA